MKEYKYTFRKFLRDWMLIIGMAAGAGLYFLYMSIPVLHPAGPFLLSSCKTIQPILLFMMLFLAFCKIEPGQMRPHRWMLSLLLVQAVLFVGIAVLLAVGSRCSGNFAALVRQASIPLEAAMLCLICPTATACAVVTGKLGGNVPGVVTYTVLINILVAVLVPLVVPVVHPQDGMSFGTAFCRILAKVFPLLIMPCLAAWLVRYLLPGLHSILIEYTDLAFYIWAVSLTLAILMSTRAIVHSGQGASILVGIAVASALSCVLQFAMGKAIGKRYGSAITAGQVLGQKNTVFAIWMGYTFLDPVVSVAGGFYSICHNCYNTWQLYRRRKVLEDQNVPQSRS